MSINDIVNINKRLFFFIGPSKLNKKRHARSSESGRASCKAPGSLFTLSPQRSTGTRAFYGPRVVWGTGVGSTCSQPGDKKGANGGRKGSEGGKGRWGRGFGRARLTRSWTYIKQVKKEGVAGPCCPIFFRWQVRWLVRDSVQENDQCLALQKHPCKRQI
jgi:hypothetical protein